MRSLDELFDTMQSPIQPLADWSKGEQEMAIVLCIQELVRSKEMKIFDVLSEAYPEYIAYGIAETLFEILEVIACAKAARETPEIDYDALYLPLEHIINDRIDYYNAS